MKSMDMAIFKSSQYASQEKYLLSLSSCVYWKNRFGYYAGCNQEVANLAEQTSKKDIIGKSDLDFSWSNRYKLYRKNDRLCEETRRPYYFFEPARTSTNEQIDRLNIKAPLLDIKKAVLGTIGISISLHHTTFNQVLLQFLQASEILQFQLDPRLIIRIVTQAMQLTHCQSQWSRESKLFDYGKISFTFREAQCLHYFLKSYSAKQTAKPLSISHKTVEFHLANIKIKLNCQTKSQIVDRAISDGFIDLMFMTF